MDERFSLANEKHLEAFLLMLVYMGAMCPKCGFGTRAISKKWRKCKRCGEKVARRELPSHSAGEQRESD
jgi:uncharacterized protein (DUF983 family)